MVFTGTGTTGEFLTRKVTKSKIVVAVAYEAGDIWYAIEGLVANGADITRVVGVRPLWEIMGQGCASVPRVKWDTDHSLQTRTIPSPTKVAHPPNGGPQTSNTG